MSIKRTLIAALAAAFAFAALPAVASAGILMDIDDEPHLEFHGGEAQLDSEAAVITCQTVTGSGEFTEDENGQAETGHIQLVLHGCTGPLGVSCTSHGQEGGTITSTDLEFHLVTGIHAEDESVVNGLLITPNEGHFASFTCSFLASVVVGGTGLLGEISGSLTETLNSFTIDFDGSAEHGQTYKTIVGDEEETEYQLESSFNESEFKPAIETAKGEMFFTRQTGTLTSSTE